MICLYLTPLNMRIYPWFSWYEVYPCCYKWHLFCSFYCWIISHCIYVPHLLIHTAVDGHLGCSHVWLGEGDGTPLRYSCLENPVDGGAWWAAVHGVAGSRIWLSDFTFTFHFHALEKEMATHSSVLAWRIPGTAEPGGLPSIGSHRVGHDWSDLTAAAVFNLLAIANYSKMSRLKTTSIYYLTVPASQESSMA